MSVGTAVVFRVTIWNGDSDADFAVSHQILQRFRVHACFRLITAIGVAADVRCDVRHLDTVDLIVFLHHSLKPMLPVQSHQRHTVLIEVQKAAVSVHELLLLWLTSVLDNRLKASCHSLGNRDLPLACIRLGGLYHILPF